MSESSISSAKSGTFLVPEVPVDAFPAASRADAGSAARPRVDKTAAVVGASVTTLIKSLRFMALTSGFGFLLLKSIFKVGIVIKLNLCTRID
jgi:hypothetical protein